MSYVSCLAGVRARAVTLTALVALPGVMLPATAGAQMLIQSINPQPNALAVSPGADVQITYATTVNFGTVNAAAIPLFGRYTGQLTASYGGTGPTVIVNPDFPFMAGERIWVTATSGIQSQAGVPGRAYAWAFVTDVLGGNSLFDSNQTIGAAQSWDVALGD
jgi:hypothetical protein